MMYREKISTCDAININSTCNIRSYVFYIVLFPIFILFLYSIVFEKTHVRLINYEMRLKENLGMCYTGHFV